MDAFYADGTAKLAAPLADFTNLPYQSCDPPVASRGLSPGAAGVPPPPPPPAHGVSVNGDHVFLGDTVFRPGNPDFSGADDTWTPGPGIHLHWALPEALTTQSKNPDSDDRPVFPKVPNRWMVILSTKSGTAWTEQKSWVVESDYLFPDPRQNPKPCTTNAISFPIAPPSAFKELLETPVSPPNNNVTAQNIQDYPFFYQAPFRCMGRNEALDAWQADAAQHEYLSQYNPAGLTAIGYGHSLFAGIYSNCRSVFGFYDDLSVASYPRRYDLVGWYDDPASDCLAHFQNLPGKTSAWDALKAEYNWTCDQESGNLPAQSVYYSRLEMDAALTGALPENTTTVTVGNTATEALSAYLAQSFQSDPADQVIVEEQLEAMNLTHKIAGENIDLAAKFVEARHDKGFRKVDGGNIWTVRARSTSASADAPTKDHHAEVTLPPALAHALNAINLLQNSYDLAWDNINSLRKNAFADWFRVEFQRVNEHLPGTQLPSINEILAYSGDSVLSPIEEQVAATGEIIFTTDATGKAKVTVKDSGKQYNVRVQYSLAQRLVDALNQFARLLGDYNAGAAAQQAKIEYYIIRKGAPRFYEPTDPAVLLDGAALVQADRYGNGDALACGLCSVTELNASLTGSLRTDGTTRGAFSILLTAIGAQLQANGLGFKNQRTQPWNPVSLEWSVSVKTELRDTSTGIAGEGVQYGADYLSGTYALDVNAADLKLNQKPYGLANPQTPLLYKGRVVLVSHAPEALQNSIAMYLMPLTLLALKMGGKRNQTISDQTDYQYDRALFTWANTMFGIAPPSFQASLKDPATLTPQQITEQQNEVAAWMARQYPFVVTVANQKALIDLEALVTAHADWCANRPVILGAATLGLFSALTTSEQAADPLATAVKSFTTLTGKSLLSQALSGFNNALLTLNTDFQLPVWDWRVMAIPEQKEYARSLVRNLNGVCTAPIFEGSFLPFRSGIMQIAGLTVVDSFGQYVELDYGGVNAAKKSERMTILNNVAASVTDPSRIATAAENGNYIYLPPRLSQAARLNFRWLAANQGNASGEGDEPEMNDHPATTPVCGWVLPNNLDGSLAIYATDGSPLGSLVQSKVGGTFSIAWESAPGINNYVPLARLPNPHLSDYVNNLISYGSAGAKVWDAFLLNINTALQNIDPKSFAQTPALSLLIGRPMALVRASVSIRTKGYPAVDHTVAAFNYDQSNNHFNRLTNGFEKVGIPVRLGEARQLNDGLVAYWIEDGQGGFVSGTNGPVHFPELEAGPVADALRVSLSGDPVKLTMLADPRGTVHATCGILPVKNISIPPDQYAKVLRTLSVTFLTSPLITPLQSIEFPIPAEAGYGWSWLDRPTGFTWNRVADIKNASREARYEQQRILEGWLKLTPQTTKEIN